MAVLRETFGNRCGHQKDKPSFFKKKQRHSLLKKAQELARKLYRESELLSKGRSRKMRSERREAITSYALYALHHVDLSTLQIGNNLGDQFLPYSRKAIAKSCNKSIYRMKRAEKAFKDNGWVVIETRYTHQNGKYVPLVAIRTLTAKFFKDLGISLKWLKKAIQQKTKEFKEKIGFRPTDALLEKEMQKLKGLTLSQKQWRDKIFKSLNRKNE